MVKIPVDSNQLQLTVARLQTVLSLSGRVNLVQGDVITAKATSLVAYYTALISTECQGGEGCIVRANVTYSVFMLTAATR